MSAWFGRKFITLASVHLCSTFTVMQHVARVRQRQLILVEKCNNSVTYDAGGVEYCQFERFTCNCSDSKVVLVTYAVYGRLRLGRCASTDYGSLGCSTDVTELLDSWCSGHTQCSFDVASLRTVVQPCPTDLTSYLDVSFTCVPGTACELSAISAAHNFAIKQANIPLRCQSLRLT